MDAGAIILSSDFGYVILVIISSIFMSWWIGFQVVKARTKFNVQVNRIYYILSRGIHQFVMGITDISQARNVKSSMYACCKVRIQRSGSVGTLPMSGDKNHFSVQPYVEVIFWNGSPFGKCIITVHIHMQCSISSNAK